MMGETAGNILRSGGAVSLMLHASPPPADSEGEEADGEEKTDTPRDSGCFESTENLENGREEAETGPAPEADAELEPEAQQEAEPGLADTQNLLERLSVEDTS